LTRIDDLDLNLFDFDYDLTFTVFFMNAEEKVYARYGGRDAESPDKRQSLEGLRYTMQSVLATHQRAGQDFAPKAQDTPKYIREVADGRRGRGCMHCHQVKEVLNSQLQRAGTWSRDSLWRYPLPENLGFLLEIDRGNVVKEVTSNSPASAAGLRAGDLVERLNGVTTHSLADVQFALDRAPKTGSIEIAWRRGEDTLREKLSLADGWRKSDLTWRPSMHRFVPKARLYGVDLTPEEKKTLGLPPSQLAFRQKEGVPSQAQAAGIRPGDIILGVDDKQLDGMDVIDFLRHVQRDYLIGDRVTINILREGKRMNLPMDLVR
jgi:predicted metalloprotease with PDZ domain